MKNNIEILKSEIMDLKKIIKEQLLSVSSEKLQSNCRSGRKVKPKVRAREFHDWMEEERKRIIKSK